MQDLLIEMVGSTEYFKAFNAARDKIVGVRYGRKRKAAELAIADPQRFAGAKIKKNLKKREDRKMKIVELRARSHKVHTIVLNIKFVSHF